MLKILFSPAEGKKPFGDAPKKELLGAQNARDEILQAYNKIVLSKDEEAIKSLFGIKKWGECEKYISDVFDSPLMSAIERYDGVAYEYLNFASLNEEEQNYLKENTIIFSNLYGPIFGGDTIANYKVKQGNSIAGIAPDKFYKERFSYQLDLLLGDKDILDLRAGYYEKFYKLTQPDTTLKFLKNGKSVSHWAKAYRGIVLKELAKHQIDSLDAFKKLEIKNLSVAEIKVVKNKTEIIYNIVE